MPLVEGYISELTDDLALRLEQEITASIREAVSQAFPPELGFTPGTEEFAIGLNVARRIMPGWTWVSLSQRRWAIQGRQVENAIAARIHILVLQNALEPQYKDHILSAVTSTVKNILGSTGKQVHLAVSMIEGDVDMTLPDELFHDMTGGSSEELLQCDNVRTFLITETMKELQSRKKLLV